MKNKFYSFINIAGLSVGLCVGMLILLWVQDEYSYDNFHSKAKNIYRLENRVGTGNSTQIWSSTVAPIAKLSLQQLPEVKDYVRFGDNYFANYRVGDKIFEDRNTTMAGPSAKKLAAAPAAQGAAVAARRAGKKKAGVDLSVYLQKILTAKVYDVAIETALDLAPSLSKRLSNQVLLKREDTQAVFSFKLRGAYNKMAHLGERQLRKGVICASAGNHAQGVALSARHLGCTAMVVMPVTTPQLKIDANPDSEYDVMAKVLAAAKNAEMKKIGFVQQ